MKLLLLLFRNMYFTNDITFDFILQRRNYVLSSQPEYTMPTLIFNQGKIRLQYHIISIAMPSCQKCPNQLFVLRVIIIALSRPMHNHDLRPKTAQQSSIKAHNSMLQKYKRIKEKTSNENKKTAQQSSIKAHPCPVSISDPISR